MPKKSVPRINIVRGRGGKVLVPNSSNKNKAKSPIQIDTWFSGEIAKRNFGALCKRVNSKKIEISLLGSEEQPLLILSNTKDVNQLHDETEISLDEAKANWSAVTAAALFFGTVFLVTLNKQKCAYLRRHNTNRHLAIVRYQRHSEDKLLKTAEIILDDMNSVCAKLDKSVTLMDSHFRKLWRESNGMPQTPP